MNENIMKIAESEHELQFPSGTVKALAKRYSVSERSVSRALHAQTKELSRLNYVSIRAAAIRDFSATPIRIVKVKI